VNTTTSNASRSGWLKTILIGLAAALFILFALVLSAFMVLRSSPSSLEYVLEEAVSRVLNRDLQIGEVLEAELGWDSYLLARDVSLSNPAWAEEPDFARAGRLLVRMNIPSTWRDGPILITELELTDARVSLLAPEGQAANWDFWPGDDGVRESLDEPELDEKLQPIFPIHISDGRIHSGVLVFRDADRDVALSIEELVLRETRDDALIYLDLDGVINEIPLTVQGRLGPAAALLTWRDVSLDLTASLGKLALQARGTIDDLENFSGPDLHLKISAPQSRPLLDLLGLEEVRDGPFNFEGHITDGHPGLAVEVVGALEEFHIQISGKLADPLNVDGVDVAFALDGPSMEEVGEIFDLQGLPEQPYNISGKLLRQGTDLTLRQGVFEAGAGRLTIEGRLPHFPGIDDWEMEVASSGFNLQMLGPLVGAQGLPEIPYDIKGSLAADDEGVELVDLRIHGPHSILILNGTVGDAPDFFDSRMKLELRGADLASMGLWLGLHDLPAAEFLVSGQVSLSDLGWQLSDGIFTTQGLKLDMSAELDKLPEPASMAVTFKLDSENLVQTLTLFGLESAGAPALPLMVSGNLSGSPDNVQLDEVTVDLGKSQARVSGIVGPPATLSTLDLLVEFKTPDLLQLLPSIEDETLPQLPVDGRSQLVMSTDGIGIEEFQGKLADTSIALNGLFNIEPPYNNSDFSLSAEGPDLGRVLGPLLERDLPVTPFQVSLDAKFESGGVQIERLEATVAEAKLSAKLSMANLDDPASARGNIQLAGSSSQKLAQFMNFESVMPDSDYSVSVGIRQSPDEWLHLDPIAVQWGHGDLTGKLDFRPGDIPTINANLHSKYINLPFLFPDLDELEKQEAARVDGGRTADTRMATGELTKKELKERVISDEPLDFSWLKKVQADIKYQVDEVYSRDDAKSRALYDISIANGVLSSRQMSWDGTFVSGDTELTIRALEAGAEIDLYLDYQRIPLLQLLGGRPRYDADAFYRAQISTKGNSFRELAKNSNGALIFQGGGGRIDNKGMDLILGDALEEILNRLNPFSETDPTTKVVCHAGAITVKDGKMAVAPGLVLRTDKMDVAIGGSIDLHREKLDLVFNTRSRKGIGISAGKAITPYFKISGTMANPRLAIDPKGVALSGSAAVATAGLSILAEGLWDRWIATAKNPCEGLISKISKENKRAYKVLLQPPA